MIEIVAANVADAAEILALQKLCYQSEARLTNDFEIPPLLQDQPSIECELASLCFLKAVGDEAPHTGRIVGSVRARECEGTCHIGRLIVHPESQNRGLGKRLMAHVEGLFPTASRFELFTGEKSVRNLHLYQKLGYRPFRTQVASHKTTLVFLEKSRA